jgi:hypothetical protein
MSHQIFDKKSCIGGASYTYNPSKIGMNTGPIFKVEYCRNKFEMVGGPVPIHQQQHIIQQDQ